jgi:uncharacterized repeat protein (TIGR01451 family)
MQTRLLPLIGSGLIALAVAIAPPAQAASPLSITTTIEKEVVVRDAKGVTKTNRVPADKVVPGETVVFTYTLTNTGTVPTESVMLVAPIPPETVYVDKSAATTGAALTFSIDKAKSFAAPDKLEVVGADGKRRRAGPSDYTHIRWMLTAPLAGAATKLVAFRAVLK